MRTIVKIAATIAVLFAAATQARAYDWRTYVNDRFGAKIDYPADIFSAEPPPENNDGLRFTSKDAAEFTMSGMYNVVPDNLTSLEESIRRRSPGESDAYANVTYRVSKGNLLILSGLRGDTIFYEKLMFTRDHQIIHHFAISYPTTAKSKYDPIVERMSKSMN